MTRSAPGIALGMLVEALQRAVEDRAAEHPVDLPVDRPGRRYRSTNHADETTPSARVRRRSTSRGFRPAAARARVRRVDRSNAPVARRRRLSHPFCVASAEAPAGSVAAARAERAQALPLRGGRFDVAGPRGDGLPERGSERHPRRRAPALPPRTGWARAAALVADGQPHEHEPPPAACVQAVAREVPVAARGIRPPRRAPRLSSRVRRGPRRGTAHARGGGASPARARARRRCRTGACGLGDR